MKILAAFAALFVLPAIALAAETGGPTEVAQGFYDAYMKVLLANGDTQKFVLTSKQVTPSFRRAYAKLVKEGMDSDPIICGQDYPNEGFAASAAKITNGKATLTMESRGDALKHSFPVTLRKVGDQWLISDTNDLKSDAAD